MKMRYYFGALIVSLLLVDCAPKTTAESVKGSAEKTMGAIDRSSAPEAGAARKVEIGTSESFTLPNGMRVIVVENHKRPTISYQLFLDNDPLVEGEYAGMTGMAGDILSRGTTTRTKAEIDEAVDFVGGSLNTNGSGGFASSLTRHSDKVLGIFADVILNPSFPAEEFEKIKTQTLSGLQQQKDDPNAIAGNVSSALVYGKEHPYGEIVNETTIQNVTVEQCKEYYQTYFRPNVAYMVVVGDITPAQAKSKLMKHFGSWKKADVPTHAYEMPASVEKTQVDFVDKAGAVQSVITITYPVDLKPGADDVIKSRVMNTILGSGFSGRLFLNLREDKGYTYGAYSSLSSDELVGSFTASASVRNEVTDSAVTEFIKELDLLRKERVTDNELELAKNYIAGAFARNLESPQTVANFALNTSRYNLPADYYATYLERLDAVTTDDVLAMAQKYVRPDKARIIVVGSQDEVSEKLAGFDAEDGKVRFYDIYANEKSEAVDVSDIKGTDVIRNYIEAIGGEAALAKIQSVVQKSSMSMMGQTIDVAITQMAPNKFHMEMSMPGMTIMKQVFDGEQGYMEQMGQGGPVEGDQLAKLKTNAMITPELEYLTEAYTVEVKGLEEVNGEKAYKVLVDGPGGKSTQYYGQESGLKLRSIETQESQGQSVTATNEFGDYREVNGILMPYVMKISGVGPPMEIITSEVKVNTEVDAALFKVQ